eukprot:GHUV01017075.1.p1 GENE.GHUV01017075.1~~GHUV01017075.1.p1  ORF type:complete len:167 (+),score=50.93 GHUV01017075.1:227-727(+)
MADGEQQVAAQQQLKRARPKNAAEGTQAQSHAPAHSDRTIEGSPRRDACSALGPSLPTAVELLSSGVSSLQSTLATVLQAAQQEREELQQAKQQLEAEKAAFEGEKQRVQHVFRDSDLVVLNVGGYRFTTTVGTLRNAPEPSLFAAMFSGRHQILKSEDGSVFIDR